MKNKKIIIILILIVIISFASLYKLERNKIYKQLESILEKVPEDYYLVCNDEFISNVIVFSGETYKYSNKELKNIYNYLYDSFDKNDYYKDSYLSFVQCINNFEKDTNCIYVTTKENYKDGILKEDGYVDCYIAFFDNQEKENRILDLEAQIKVRGNTTATGAKKPYNIKFSEKVDLLNCGSSKKWSLLADCYDKTLLRNKTFLNLAESLDLEYTSKCEYIDLYFNNQYVGVYLLVEPVEIGKNRVDINEENNEFIFEYEASRVEEDKVYITSTNNLRFVLDDPETADKDELNSYSETINNFDHAIFSDDYSIVADEIDVDSFAKFYLLNEFAKTVDFNCSSVKFYNKSNKIYAGPVWDFDYSSGNSNLYYYPAYWNIKISDGSLVVSSVEDLYAITNPIFGKLLEYGEFKERVCEIANEYDEEFKKIYIENGIIDDIVEDNYLSFRRNYESKELGGAGWDINGMYSSGELFALDDYDNNILYLKEFLKNRWNYLRSIYK